MTKQILNTLFVLTEGSYVHLDHETVRIDFKDEKKMQVPLHHLASIVVLGNVLVSPFLIHRCADEGKSIVFLDRIGRFKARLEGPVSGNVLLRCAQHRIAKDREASLQVARRILAGKLQNCRQVLMRGAREVSVSSEGAALRKDANSLSELIEALHDAELHDQLRGIEGQAARIYFNSFNKLIKCSRESFNFTARSRRPPLDPLNAVLSFLYTLLVNDCATASEAVGLDPQVGFLHALRPGRPALALDLMEELRPIVVDRLVLALINRRQLQPGDFEERPGGSVFFNDAARKNTITEYQKRKESEVTHAALEKKLPLGLLPFTQAQLMARHLRGDLPDYLPFIVK